MYKAGRVLGAFTVLLIGGAACLAQSEPGRVLVADVVVQGNQHVPTQKIISLLRTRPGKPYDRAIVSDDVRRIYDTRSIANVRVELKEAEQGQVIVYFIVAELPDKVEEILYIGAGHIKDDELNRLTGLRKGMPLNPVANQLGKQAILRKYQEKGRLFASVELVEGDKPGDRRVVYHITEGPVVRVSSVSIEGCQFVSSARLKTQIDSSRAFLGMLGGQFNPQMADQDMLKLEEYYKTFGFHDVRVSRELRWDESHRYVDLIFHIDEGVRYRVGNVDVVGNRHFDRDKLLGMTRLEPGKHFNGNVVKVDKEIIKASYGYTGRDASVVERVTYRPGEVDVKYEIEERPPSQVGEIIIIGNTVTRDSVIRRQIPLYPGQLLTYPEMRVAEANLARLNIFDVNPEMGIRPTVTVIDPDSDNPVKDILVNVQETQTGSLLFGLGFNSDAGFTGSIVLNERNFDITRFPTSIEDLLSGRAFRGGGQEFRIEAIPGNELQRYTVSFREPFLFDSQYSLSTGGYYWTRRYIEYDERRYGGRFNVGRRLGRYWNFNAGARIEGIGIYNVPFFAPPQITDDAGDSFLTGLRAGLNYDTRDSFLRPTSGTLVDISYEQGLGTYTFPLFSVEANKYWTIYERPDGSGRHVLAARSQLGIAGANTPVYERFFAGGFRSLRGFEFRGVGPNVDGFMVGGDFMFLNSIEYQLPVLANDQLYFVGFVDSGTVEENITIQNYRVSAGVGVRVVVPMLGPVPIALDFGFPIVKAPTDREQVFSFWVGFFH